MHGLAGLGQVHQLAREPGRRDLGQADLDEHAVVAVHLRVAELLEVHRQDAAALLAGALGDELLDPGAERPKLGLGDDGQLVAAGQGGLAQHGAEAHGRVLAGRDVRAARDGRGADAVEQPLEVGADQRRRDHAEEAQRGVAAADVRGVDEHGAEALVERLLLERRALVGDGHEVVAGVVSVQLPEALVEVGVEAGRLRGAAGLARDDEERRLEVHGRLHGAARPPGRSSRARAGPGSPRARPAPRA